VDKTVSFENISKKYTLGLIRTSLPSHLSQWIKEAFNPKTGKAAQDKSFWALRNINFELRKGESLALVGANGAGKTTILKLLANITKPTKGSITINGTLSALIELGAGFHPDLTGRENVYLNGAILGLSKREIARRFDEIVNFAEIGRFIDTPIKRYSSGMIVRLGFSVASCVQPDILLVDEVLAVGDASFQQKCMRRIRSLIDSGTSIIFVSHNFYLVQAACNRALYIECGQVRFAGEVNEVIGRYEHDLHMQQLQRFASSDGNSATSELRDKKGDDVEITNVEVSGVSGTQTEALLSNQAARIRIHYHAFRSTGNVQMSVFLVRSDGLNCGMKRSYLDGFSFQLDKGAGMITLHLEKLQLVSGTYFAEAWFLDEMDSMSITTKSCRSDWFMVKSAALTYDGNAGVFEPIGWWEHNQNGLPPTKTSYSLAPTCIG
jgi:lipopolysaccharide transport system ATP-binding protein